MESENEEDAGVVSYKNKYHQLKSRLKYLIYVSVYKTEDVCLVVLCHPVLFIPGTRVF